MFGAVSGFVIAVRGREEWAALFVLCVVGYIWLSIVGYILKH